MMGTTNTEKGKTKVLGAKDCCESAKRSKKVSGHWCRQDGGIANDHHIWVRKRERRLQKQTRFRGSTVIVKNGYCWGNLRTDNYFSKSYAVLQYSLHRLNYCCNAALCSLVEIRICTIAFLPSQAHFYLSTEADTMLLFSMNEMI